MHTTNIDNAEPDVARNAGSQPPGDPLASPQTGGLAVMAPGAEKSAPAADEKDLEIQDLRADIVCKDARIRNLHDEIASLGEVITTKNKVIEALEAELAYLRGVTQDQAHKIRTGATPPAPVYDEVCNGLVAA